MFFQFPMVVRSAATAGVVIAAVAQVIAGKPAVLPNVIYTTGSEVPALDRTAAKSFSDKYRIVTMKPGQDFVPARVKGNEISFPYGYDPRPMREMKTPAKASIGFVVTAEGYIRDLRVLESTDPRVADYLIQQIQMRRFAPAKYRGAAVASLDYRQVLFGPIDDKDSGMGKNGLGIMGYRDR